jgi:hypothetical protein
MLSQLTSLLGLAPEQDTARMRKASPEGEGFDQIFAKLGERSPDEGETMLWQHPTDHGEEAVDSGDAVAEEDLVEDADAPRLTENARAEPKEEQRGEAKFAVRDPEGTTQKNPASRSASGHSDHVHEASEPVRTGRAKAQNNIGVQVAGDLEPAERRIRSDSSAAEEYLSPAAEGPKRSLEAQTPARISPVEMLVRHASTKRVAAPSTGEQVAGPIPAVVSPNMPERLPEGGGKEAASTPISRPVHVEAATPKSSQQPVLGTVEPAQKTDLMRGNAPRVDHVNQAAAAEIPDINMHNRDVHTGQGVLEHKNVEVGGERGQVTQNIPQQRSVEATAQMGGGRFALAEAGVQGIPPQPQPQPQPQLSAGSHMHISLETAQPERAASSRPQDHANIQTGKAAPAAPEFSGGMAKDIATPFVPEQRAASGGRQAEFGVIARDAYAQTPVEIRAMPKRSVVVAQINNPSIADPSAVKDRPLPPEFSELFGTPGMSLTSSHSLSGAGLGMAPTPLRASAVMPQIVDAVPRLADGGVEIRLDPEELGRVRLQLVPGDQGMSVVIQAERPETLDLMRRNAADLERALAEAGYDATEFSFGQDGFSDQGTGHGESGSGYRADDETTEMKKITVTSDGLDIRI